MHRLPPVWRLILRWGYIAVLTVFAFHASLLSLVETTRAGGLNGYVWTVPLAGVIAAIGVARRSHTELPIHDRQTDVIVGIMGLVLAGVWHAVLLQRYTPYFHLLRLDLVALWMFVLSASIALFGLRPVTRFAWVWVMLFMVFPLPYHLIVVLLGGTRVAAGVGTMIIAVSAVGIAVGRHPKRGWIGWFSAWAVGLVILAVMAVLLPDAPLLAYQLIPAISSICLVGMTMFLTARRGAPKRVLDRKIEPLAAGQIWSAIPVVLIVAVALSFVRLPVVPTAFAARVDSLSFARYLIAPPGWRIVDTTTHPWVHRMYGSGSLLVRQKMVAEAGDPRFDKFARPRTLVVDSTYATRPSALDVYPSRLLYNVQGIRLSAFHPVDLGYGVHADMVAAVDDRLLVTWDMIQWNWTNGNTAQRVSVFAVDNHEDNAPFPQPTGALLPTLNSMFTVLLRGNAATIDTNPVIKDARLLTDFSHALVRAQLEPLGVKP